MARLRLARFVFAHGQHRHPGELAELGLGNPDQRSSGSTGFGVIATFSAARSMLATSIFILYTVSIYLILRISIMSALKASGPPERANALTALTINVRRSRQWLIMI
jgi:hypothetical protein